MIPWLRQWMKKRGREENLKRVLERIQPPIHSVNKINETLNQLGILDLESRVFIRKHFENETAKILAREEAEK